MNHMIWDLHEVAREYQEACHMPHLVVREHDAIAFDATSFVVVGEWNKHNTGFFSSSRYHPFVVHHYYLHEIGWVGNKIFVHGDSWDDLLNGLPCFASDVEKLKSSKLLTSFEEINSWIWHNKKVPWTCEEWIQCWLDSEDKSTLSWDTHNPVDIVSLQWQVPEYREEIRAILDKAKLCYMLYRDVAEESSHKKQFQAILNVLSEWRKQHP